MKTIVLAMLVIAISGCIATTTTYQGRVYHGLATDLQEGHSYVPELDGK